MRKMLIVTTALFLAGATGAMAEDNTELLQPVAYGAVTGDAEKDTVAYDVQAPSDLWVRFSDECVVQGASLVRGPKAEVAAASPN